MLSIHPRPAALVGKVSLRLAVDSNLVSWNQDRLGRQRKTHIFLLVESKIRIMYLEMPYNKFKMMQRKKLQIIKNPKSTVVESLLSWRWETQGCFSSCHP